MFFQTNVPLFECFMSEASYNKARRFKLVLAGKGGVGKSSLFRAIESQRDGTHIRDLTIGVGFLSRDLEVEGNAIRLQFWDTEGSEYARPGLRRSYFRASSVIILCFDLSKSESDELDRWMKEAKEVLDDSSRATFVVVGCKKDLVTNDSAAELRKQVWSFCKVHDAPYHETSAKTLEGVEELVLKLGPMSFSGPIRLHRQRRVRQTNAVLEILWKRNNGCFSGVRISRDVLQLLKTALEETVGDAAWGLPNINPPPVRVNPTQPPQSWISRAFGAVGAWLKL